MQCQLSLVLKTCVGVRVHDRNHAMVYTSLWTRAVDKEWISVIDSDSVGWWIVKHGIDRVEARGEAWPSIHQPIWHTRILVCGLDDRVVCGKDLVFFYGNQCLIILRRVI